MTLADRLDALLTRPIYDCDLETIREAAKRLRALEAGSGAMTDIVERLREGDFGPTYGPSGIELEAADEITRLRTERAELIEALEAVVIGCVRYDECPDSLVCRHAYDAGLELARSILSKIKEQKA